MSGDIFLIDGARLALSDVLFSLVRAARGARANDLDGDVRITISSEDTASIGDLFAAYESCYSQLLCVADADPTKFVYYIGPNDGTQPNPLPSHPHYGKLCAMLALTFPDLHFARLSGLGDVLEAVSLRRAGFAGLMDGTGARDAIRAKMIEDTMKIPHNVASSPLAYLPRRVKLAIAIDDEPAYASLHAYSAFRFGFRAIPVSTQILADALLDTGKPTQGDVEEDLQLTIEDLYIGFPDKHAKDPTRGEAVHYSNLRHRQESWPRLANTKFRVFVTSGHHQGDKETRTTSDKFIEEEEKKTYIRTLHKPHAGMFRIWEDSGLAETLPSEAGKKYRAHAGKFRIWVDCGLAEKLRPAKGKKCTECPGVASGYVWPPDSTPTGSTSHSAEGVLTLVAQKLMHRAEDILARGAPTVEAAIGGAVFATEALELLGGRTPTTSIEALRLRHECEVTAECRFSGVEHHILLVPRIKEIRRNVSYISSWFHPGEKRNATLNAEMAILNRLTLVFRGAGQFDEEQVCLVRIRHLQNELWRRSGRDAARARVLLWPVHWYMEQLLTSLTRFTICMIAWIVVLTCAYGATLGGHYLRGFESAVSSFFSMGAPFEQCDVASRSQAYVNVVCASIFLGFLHLGVFVSHLYSIVARK